jgi:NAD(P)-dependent dehydrogenase (short-subunit alcohol dehydrogenase family)
MAFVGGAPSRNCCSFGTHDGLVVSVAARFLDAGAPFLTVTEKAWAATLAVNLTGSFLTAQGAARIMLRNPPLQ